VLQGFLSLKLLVTIAILAFGTVAVGVIMWMLERGRNPQQFGGTWKQGIGAGMWWSAVTMTTVGYGDKTPTTLAGRLIALIWMFTAIIIISVFTATVTATLTVSQLETTVKGPNDLPNVRVGTVTGSTSERYLKDHHLRYTPYKNVLDGMRSVANDTIDAMVYDAPMLRYLANTELNGAVYVLPVLFERQYYGGALPANSILRKRINQVLLDETHQAQWADILYQYLGE
jgi:ABC-type amino acid transport substrate-binding protein